MPRYLVVIEPTNPPSIGRPSFSASYTDRRVVCKVVDADSYDEAADEANPEANTRVRVIDLNDVVTFCGAWKDRR